MAKVTFKLDIESENDEFQGDPLPELFRIMRNMRQSIVDGMEADGGSGRVRDVNGNTVGHWALLFEEI